MALSSTRRRTPRSELGRMDKVRWAGRSESLYASEGLSVAPTRQLRVSATVTTRCRQDIGLWSVAHADDPPTRADVLASACVLVVVLTACPGPPASDRRRTSESNPNLASRPADAADRSHCDLECRLGWSRPPFGSLRDSALLVSSLSLWLPLDQHGGPNVSAEEPKLKAALGLAAGILT
jgi:hypothetical protein